MPAKQEAVRELFQSNIMFALLTDSEKSLIEPLFEIENYAMGDVIARQYEPIAGMYTVYSGKIRLKNITEEGKRHSLGELESGSSLGEISLLKSDNWKYEVVASTDVVLFKIPGQKVMGLLETNPRMKSTFRKQIGIIEMGNRVRGLLGSGKYTPELFSEILNNMGVKNITSGKFVFKQEQDDPRLYYIESGSVELVKETLDGAVVLDKVSTGTLLGEEGALTQKPQGHSAKAVTDVTVLVIKQNEVRKIFEINDELRELLDDRIKLLKVNEDAEVSSIKRAEGADQRITIDAITESEFKEATKKKEIHRFPIVKQQEESECAAACLTMITKHYGKDFTLGQVMELASTSTAGATVHSICNSAESMGFRAKPYQIEYEHLKRLELPVIIHWEGYHYEVLYRVKGKYVFLADPALGLRKLKRAEFEAGWDGVVITLTPTQKFTQLTPPSNPYLHFINYLLPYKKFFAEAFIATLIINMLGLASPLFIQNIVDSVVVHSDKALLNMMLAGMALVAIFSTISGGVQNLLLAHTIARVDMKIMSEFYRHILSLPMNFFLGRRTGDILSRFGENQKIRGIITGSSITVILNTLMIVLYLTMMVVYNETLTMIVMIFVPMYIGITLYFTPKIKKLQNQMFLTGARQQSYLIESLVGIEAVKSTANEYYVRSRWENAFVDNINHGYRVQKIAMLSGTLNQMVSLSSTIAILWFGANLVMEGELTIGELMGFNMLMGLVMGPIMQMVGLWNNFQEIRISIERVSDINNVKPEQEPITVPERLPTILKTIQGKIEFRHIKFRYGGEESPLILNDFNLTIEPGQTVAFVGGSGCGKSTAIKMVMGFNLPVEGEFLIDGFEIKSLDLSSYRRSIGIVLQDSFLFGDTVAANIALGDPNPDMVAVKEASRLSSADDFIARMPLGYQTLIGEKGIQVSGGQRQRICIARALYWKPRILVFDEATSALDNESEAKIQKNMRSIISGKTSIMIAHRLSTVMDCDYICFIEDGAIVEKGAHEELIALKGKYYNLAKKQFNLD